MYFLLEAAATESLFSVLMANTMPFVVVLGVMYFMLSLHRKREKKECRICVTLWKSVMA